MCHSKTGPSVKKETILNRFFAALRLNALGISILVALFPALPSIDASLNVDAVGLRRLIRRDWFLLTRNGAESTVQNSRTRHAFDKQNIAAGFES
jgi:hypothetical protein